MLFRKQRSSNSKATRPAKRKPLNRRSNVESMEERITFSVSPVDPGANFGAIRDTGGLQANYLNLDGDAFDEIRFDYGLSGDKMHAGDFNGDGFDNIAAVRNHVSGGLHWLINDDGDPNAEFRFQFGLHGDKTAVGDFNGDGIDDVAAIRADNFFDPNVGLTAMTWYVAHGPFPSASGSGADSFVDVDDTFVFGFDGDTPVVGDWEGDGIDTVGVVSQRPEIVNGVPLSRWYLLENDGINTYDFGYPTDIPVVNDWDGDGDDDLGVVRESPGQLSQWFGDTNRDPNGEIQFGYGLYGDQYVTGRWEDARPTVSVGDASVTEGDSGTKSVNVAVRLDKPSNSVVQVGVTTIGDTAQEGSDFIAKTETLVFAPGETVKNFAVQIVGDTVSEGDLAERLQVRVTGASNAFVGDGTGIVSINDNDSVATGSISGVKWNDLNANSQYDEGEPLIPNWQMYIDANNNARLDAGEVSAFTDSDGVYTFDNLDAGTYIIREVIPSDWVQTFPRLGGNRCRSVNPILRIWTK